MASKETSSDGQCLKDVFQNGWNLLKRIETDDRPSGSDDLQALVEQVQQILISSTNMVNSLQLFSCNEEIEEVSTSNLRYFLIPAFLGDLSLRQVKGDRCHNVQSAKVYLLDYLKRCISYGIGDKGLPKIVSQFEDSPKSSKELSQLGIERQEKIERLKETKRLIKAIETLEGKLKVSEDAVDEDVQREYYLSWLRLWINRSVEHLVAIEKELEILEHMKTMALGNGPKPKVTEPRKPFKPVLITRDMIREKVFGLGYPSLPTMSQEEYFEKEIAEGKIVLDYESSGGQDRGRHEEDEQSKDDEDSDDESKLQRTRAMDEFKDDHRRGEGNRYNRS